jgi:hypothetical protein
MFILIFQMNAVKISPFYRSMILREKAGSVSDTDMLEIARVRGKDGDRAHAVNINPNMTNDSKDKEATKRRTKPTIFLHVGPPKTGTTSTQVALTIWKDALLQHDHMEYLGFHMWPDGKWQNYGAAGRGLADTQCLAKSYRASKNNQKRMECFDTFLESLNKKYSSSESEVPNDLILSDEVFTRNRGFLWETQKLEYLAANLQDKYNLEVIITYRRIEDWYPSARRQINIRAQNIGSWKGPIEPLFPEVLKWARKQSHGNYPSPAELIGRFTRASGNDDTKLKYHVYNFHKSTNLFQTLACDILDARHACYLSKLENTTQVYMGDDKIEKDFLLYDEILSMAANRSLFNGERIKRRKALKKTHRWFTTNPNATIRDLPMKCPSRAELEEFLSISLMTEKSTVPEFASASGVEQSHNESFWNAADSAKFCSVDVETVLKDPEWLRYFSSFRK